MPPNPLEDYDSDEDEDYVPDGGDSEDEGGKRGKGKAKTKKKPAGRRQGGIVLEGESAELADEDVDEDEGEDDSPEDKGKIDSLWAELNSAPAPKKGAPPAPEFGAAAKRPAVDDIWAQMNAPSATKKPATGPSAAGGGFGCGFGMGSVASAKPSERGAATASRPEQLPKTGGDDPVPFKYGNPNVKPSKRAGFITITETKDFAGEKIDVDRDVRIGSKEELALRVAGGGGGGGAEAANLGGGLKAAQALAAVRALNRGVAGAAAAPKAPAGAAPGAGAGAPGGLGALLAKIDKPKKMSTMEKSQLDWRKFKTSQEREELEAMEAFAKDGYLEKQAFKQRMDERQHANARDVRRKRMGIKD